MAEVKLQGKDLVEDVLSADPPEGSIAFWWLGQASFIFKGGGRTLLIDPYLAPHPARQTPPLLAPEEVTFADYILCTHDHADHIDPEALPGIAQASPHCRFIIPRPTRRRVENLGIRSDRLISLSHGEGFREGPFRVLALKAKHEFFDEDPFEGFPYLGYCVTLKDFRFYHSGDTIPYEGLVGMLRAFQPDAMFLPINGRDAQRYRAHCIGNCTFQEAVDLAGEVGPRWAIPMHWDMFVGNSEDPAKFVGYLQAKYPHIQTWVGPAGERINLLKGQ